MRRRDHLWVTFSLALLAAAAPVGAQQAASASYTLQAGRVVGGGAVGMKGPGPSPSVGSAGTTLGQSTPAGVASGATSGTQLRSGLWSVAGTRPLPLCGDVNGNGQVSLADALLIQRSLLQPPTATLTRPNLCDVNGDGRCTLADSLIVRRSLLVPPTATIVSDCQP